MRYIHLRLTYLLTYLHQPVNFTQFAATFQIVMHSKAPFPTKNDIFTFLDFHRTEIACNSSKRVVIFNHFLAYI